MCDEDAETFQELFLLSLCRGFLWAHRNRGNQSASFYLGKDIANHALIAKNYSIPIIATANTRKSKYERYNFMVQPKLKNAFDHEKIDNYVGKCFMNGRRSIFVRAGIILMSSASICPASFGLPITTIGSSVLRPVLILP